MLRYISDKIINQNSSREKELQEANDIINGNTIYQDNECESVEYYHLECEENSAIYANCILYFFFHRVFYLEMLNKTH